MDGDVPPSTMFIRCGAACTTGATIVVVVAAVIVLVAFVLSLLLPGSPRRRRRKRELLSHVIITGGSSGIGLAVAQRCVSLPGSPRRRVVTLIARNREKLEEAKKTVEAMVSPDDAVVVVTLPLDVTDPSILHPTSPVIRDHVEKYGPPTVLFNVAGTSVASAFVDTPVETFRRLLDVNYLGSVYATRAFLPHFDRIDGGAVVFTSSAAGQAGIYGFSAYSASKFALRGLAEALDMELRPRNVTVTVAYPPDTDTPGYADEMDAGKPMETHLISENAGLWDAHTVAKKIVDGTLQGRSAVWFGLEGWMLTTLTAGMGDVGCGVLGGLCQVCLMGTLRLVGLVYLADFRRIVRRCKRERGAEGAASAKVDESKKED